jgi:hypothetical protein
VGDADAQAWASNRNRSVFDGDLGACAQRCAGAAKTETLSACVADCLADTSDSARAASGVVGLPYSRDCSDCLGELAQCLAAECGRCGSRGASTACAECSEATCEPRLLACTGWSAVPAAVVSTLPAVDAPASGSSTVLVVAGGLGGLVALVAVGAALVVRRRRSRANDRQPDKLARRESPNPLFTAMGGGPTSGVTMDSLHDDDVPLGLSGAAHRVSARLVASNASVKFPFKAQAADELDVRSGERLEVVQLIDREWAQCRNERGQHGIVPLNVLKRDAR